MKRNVIPTKLMNRKKMLEQIFSECNQKYQKKYNTQKFKISTIFVKTQPIESLIDWALSQAFGFVIWHDMTGHISHRLGLMTRRSLKSQHKVWLCQKIVRLCAQTEWPNDRKCIIFFLIIYFWNYFWTQCSDIIWLKTNIRQTVDWLMSLIMFRFCVINTKTKTMFRFSIKQMI